MKRKFAVFDIDGTLIRWQLYHAVVDALAKPSPKTLETIKQLRKSWKTRSSHDSFRQYERELISIFGRLIAELSSDEFEQAIDSVFEEYKDQVYTYTRDLLSELKEKNYLLLAISGSHSEIVGRVAEYYGFDDFIGAVYEQKANRFTGRKIPGAKNKDASLKKLIEKHGAGYAGSLGIGDSKNDAAFLELVEQPIAFNPDKELFEIARRQDWKIVVERKNIIYKLESKHGRYILEETNDR